jgi:mannose-6-phosphate isomerase-like protein (cupin superfamily)/catechol 2,3-dioxygenase-like lactoylglutathione lyase family enzyme
MITLQSSVSASDSIVRGGHKVSAPAANGSTIDRIGTVREPDAQAPRSRCNNTGVHHVGLHASNPAASAEFYRNVLGMNIVGGSSADHPLGATAFLSSRPDEESHEIALFANPAFAHVAFKVSSLSELRSVHARVVERDIPIKFAADHGVSLAFYFDDPDGNLVEVYWPTRGTAAEPLQPHMEALDLSQPDTVLLEKIKARQDGAFTNQPQYVPAGSGSAYSGPGDQITFLLTGEQTGGAFLLAEVSVPPGGGTPPHLHRREEETFYVMQGTLRVQIGSETVQASAGDCVYLPRGITHCFTNTGSGEAKFLMMATPAGLEYFFVEGFRPVVDGVPPAPTMTEAMLNRLVAAAARSGLEFAPPSLG